MDREGPDHTGRKEEGLKKIKITQVYDGEWIRPTPQRGHIMKCCNCGLTHRINFRVTKRGVMSYAEFQPFRMTNQLKPKDDLGELVKACRKKAFNAPTGGPISENFSFFAHQLEKVREGKVLVDREDLEFLCNNFLNAIEEIVNLRGITYALDQEDLKIEKIKSKYLPKEPTP